MKHIAIPVLLVFAELTTWAQSPRTIVVEGRVVDRPYSHTVLISPFGQDMRVNPPQEASIHDGRFQLTLEAQPQAYELTFADEWQQGVWQPVVFFPDADTIRMTLFPMDSASMNRIDGGPDNAYLAHMDSVYTCRTPVFMAWDSLQESRYTNHTLFNAEAAALLDRINHEEDRATLDSLLKIWDAKQKARTHMTPEATATDRLMCAYRDSVNEARYEHIRRHPSLAGYYRLYSEQFFKQPGDVAREEIYRTVYAVRYPEHPYTKQLDQMFYHQIETGKPFVDFEAPDLDNHMHRLSEKIAGEIALIDLWASWCGSCRRNSIAVIPIYNEFKDKGFTVVGVARESDNTNAMHRAIEKDGYPWLNLVELNDRAGIWQLYGISNAGGGQFLVDRDGTVLAINPTAAELRKILSEKLN